jgi:hypothetical protein
VDHPETSQSSYAELETNVAEEVITQELETNFFIFTKLNKTNLFFKRPAPYLAFLKNKKIPPIA